MEEFVNDAERTIRRATRADIPAIVHLLADDPLGQRRERDQAPLPDAYYDAFERIDGDPRNALVVVEAHGEVIGTLQLTLLPYLTYQGGTRGQIEAVRVDRRYRSQGVGHDLLVWAIERAGGLPPRPTDNKRQPRRRPSLLYAPWLRRVAHWDEARPNAARGRSAHGLNGDSRGQ